MNITIELLQTLLFYAFSAVTVIAALMVISLKNPVHSVLSLILAFFSSAWLFIMLGAEFVAMILIIVYVGAVAVLFLFVVMMMDINFAELKQGFLKYLPAGFLVGVILFIEIAAIMIFSTNNDSTKFFTPEVKAKITISNTEALGNILYTDYFLVFQMAGLILLVAMIGAIVLTLRHRPGVKRQKAWRQVSRNPKDSIQLVKVETGKGI